jgi:predicted phosphoribosyltransferase
MFLDREDAARKLAAVLKDRHFHDPLVLGIPRGGVVLGATLAKELGADLDVVLARKLRAPGQSELALGAISENGEAIPNPHLEDMLDGLEAYLAREREIQKAEIARRSRLYRAVRPAVPVAGRSVIVVDDGIATGSTMIAALRATKAQKPRELICAVPVAAPDRLKELVPLCDEIVCLLKARNLLAVGQFYQDFRQVEDDAVLEALRSAAGREAKLRKANLK